MRGSLYTARCSMAVRAANSEMSAPATNAFSPAPWITTTFTASSSLSSAKRSFKSRRTSLLRALSL